MTERDRWAAFSVGELQQLLGAAITGQEHQIFGTGPGNLLPRLVEELSGALDRATLLLPLDTTAVSVHPESHFAGRFPRHAEDGERA